MRLPCFPNMSTNVNMPLPDEPALVTLTLDGTAYFNRQASRVLPAGITQLRLVRPATLGVRWLLLPGIPGGLKVRARTDRLGYLRVTATELATHAFAACPRGTVRIYLELVPIQGGFFALQFVGAEC
jgi:hypothetical protein